MSQISRAYTGNIGTTKQTHAYYSLPTENLQAYCLISFLFGSWLVAVIIAAYSICKWVAGFGVV